MAGACLAEAPADQPLQLKVVGTGRDDDAIEVRGVAGFVKKRDFDNGQCRIAELREGPQTGLDRPIDGGMDHRFEFPASGGVGKDDGSKRVAVDRAILRHDAGTKSGRDRGCCFSASRGYSVSEIVGDKTRDAVTAELIQDVALACGGSARQRDS